MNYHWHQLDADGLRSIICGLRQELESSERELARTLDEAKIALDEFRADKERLDWLQGGHCVYAICGRYAQGYAFEIDGDQGAPRFELLRDAIDAARKEPTP
jgi:hypothetical protein